MSFVEEKSSKCLIFFESFRKEGEEKLPVSIASARVYALVAETEVNNFQGYFDRFSRKQIHIVTHGQDPTGSQILPKNLTFEIFEMAFSHDVDAEQSNRVIPCVEIDEINKDVMKSLLGRMPHTSSLTDLIRDTDPDPLCHPGALPRFFSIIEENLRFIEKWLDHGAELVYRHRNRETLLHFAVRMDSESLVNTLLRFNFDVDAARYDGLVPLHIAAKRGHLGILVSLMLHGAKVKPPVGNYRGLTPLMLAAKRGHLDVVKSLIRVSYQAGSVNDINAVRSPDGESCLHLAAWNGHSTVVETLLQHGADIGARIKLGHPYGGTPLGLAVNAGHTEVAKVLLRVGSDVNTIYDVRNGKKSVLFYAIDTKELRMIELILAHHPDPSNHFNQLAFYHALATQNEVCEAAVKIMCQNGFTVVDESLETLDESQTLRLLFGAIVKNCHSAVKAVLKNRDIVNLAAKPGLPDLQFKCTGLHLAALHADDEMLKVLVDHNADVNSHDGDGKTPLFYAVATEKMNSLKFLIAHQAEIENRPELVYPAIYHGNFLILETLLLNGAKVNEPYDGETIQLPLLSPRRAAGNPYRRNSTYVTISLENPSAPQPPILYAISRPNSRIVKLMLKYGAFQTSGSGLRLRFIKAANNRRLETFRVLLEYEFPKTLANCGLNTLFNHSRDRECVNTIAKYIIKIKSCGLPVSTDTLPDLWSLPMTMEEFQANCEAEITKLKSDKVGITDLSFYDILIQDVNTISGYARNDVVVDVFQTGGFRKRFPIYASIIESQFEKGHHRRCLLTRAVKICCILSEQFKVLPDNLKEEIINYLDNDYLQYLNSSSRVFFKEE